MKYYLVPSMIIISRFIEIIFINQLTSLNIISQMKSVFNKYGIPNMVVSNNDGQYKSDILKQFAE